MKNAILALGLVALLAACGNKNGGSSAPPPQNPNAYAAMNLPPECGGPTQTALPYEYQNSGCSPYNWDQAGHFRHGGCPRYTFAACAAGVGMICVPQDIAAAYQVAWFNYHDGTRSAAFCGYEGVANRGACAYRSMPGAGNIGRACIVGNGVNECGFGHCQPIGSVGGRDRDDGCDRDGDRDDDHDHHRFRAVFNYSFSYGYGAAYGGGYGPGYGGRGDGDRDRDRYGRGGDPRTARVIGVCVQ